MDERKHLILLKGKNKTKDIRFIKLIEQGRGYDSLTSYSTFLIVSGLYAAKIWSKLVATESLARELLRMTK